MEDASATPSTSGVDLKYEYAHFTPVTFPLDDNMNEQHPLAMSMMRCSLPFLSHLERETGRRVEGRRSWVGD